MSNYRALQGAFVLTPALHMVTKQNLFALICLILFVDLLLVLSNSKCINL